MNTRGENYYKVVSMKLEGIPSNRIAKRLNISRERVRQLWVSHQIRNNKDDFRICSKCNKKFLPKYKFQSTCGCYVSIFDKCSICAAPTQFLKKQRIFPICTDIGCAKDLKVLKSRFKKLSLERRDLEKTELTCPVCSVNYLAPLWQARSHDFKMRCKSCRDGQKKGICTVCKIPITKTDGRCKPHYRLKIN